MAEVITKSIYYVYADVNNEGRKCIFQSKDWKKAKRLIEKIKNQEFAGCYMNAKLERK